MIGITLNFDYPWENEAMDENDIVETLFNFSAEELLVNAMKAGNPVNVDVEVY